MSLIKPVFTGMVALLFSAGVALASTAPQTPGAFFQLGKDYERLPQKVMARTQPTGREVVEFFSYECPACNRLEPSFGQWVKKAPKGVTVKRVPVVFRPSWEPLAKAYYIAQAFEVESQVTPAMFKAIHVEGKDMTQVKNLEMLFAKFGVKPQDFRRAFEASPAIDAQLKRGDELMRQYQIFQVPTLVVNGQFTTGPGFTRGDSKRLIAVVDYLLLTKNPAKGQSLQQVARQSQ